jgi:hypothetical protein
MPNGKDFWWIMNWSRVRRSCWTMNLGTTPAYTGKDLGESWKHNSGQQSQAQDLERGRGGRRVGVLQDWGFHSCFADNLHRLRCNAVSHPRRNECSKVSCCNITVEYTNPPVLSRHLKWFKFLSNQNCWKNRTVTSSETWGKCILGIRFIINQIMWTSTRHVEECNKLRYNTRDANMK